MSAYRKVSNLRLGLGSKVLRTSTFLSSSTRTGREVGVPAEELGLFENKPSFDPELSMWSRSFPVTLYVSQDAIFHPEVTESNGNASQVTDRDKLRLSRTGNCDVLSSLKKSQILATL